jgi:hypothetical protein
MMVAIPLMLFFWNYSRCANKTLCLFLEPDKSVTHGLLPHDEDFVYDHKNGNAYYIFEDRIRFVRYPTGWPIFLQQTVPMALYKRGDGEPLPWDDLGTRTVSSKEVGAAMEPQWLKNIIKGASEAQGESRMGRMMPVLTLAAVLIMMVFLFIVISKVGNMESAVNVLKESSKLGQ